MPRFKARARIGWTWCASSIVSMSAAMAAPASAAPPNDAVTRLAAPALAPETRAVAVAAAALPRQFTVELTRDGSVFADGARASTLEEVEARARRAVGTPNFYAGASVFADLPDHDVRVRELVAALGRAGFLTIRSAGRAAPAEVSGAAPVFPPMTAPARVDRGAAGAPVTARKVDVVTVGLHVAGPLNQAAQRRRLVRVFEKKFGAFERCHGLANQREKRASFGVDLLIPPAGGRGAVRETRTRLSGDAFRSCMRRAFEAISFERPPTARPEIVSYSLLFKPIVP